MNISRFIVGVAVVLSLLSAIPLAPSTATPDNYVIDGNLVYIDDANVYLSAYPHTLFSSGWVYFNFTSKVYTGDIDFTLGYDGLQVKPKKHELYQPHWINWTTDHKAYFDNVTNITTYAGDVFDYGNEYNAIKRQITYGNDSLVVNVSFDSFTQDGNNYLIEWYTNHARHELYSKFPQQPDHISFNFQGMTDWYYIKNIPIVQDKNYQMRVWVDVPISLEPISSKYFFALKASTDTIGQAITNNRFYVLDPWYNASWGKRKQVTVTHTNASGDTLLNYPVFINVTDEAEMQADYDDVIFVNDTTDTIMAYELENYTTDYALYWVNVTHLTTPNKTFWMYYDNAGATSQEDMEGVWDENYVFVQHFENLTDSTRYSNDLSNVGSTYDNTWALDGERVLDGTSDYLQVAINPTLSFGSSNFTIETWVNVNATQVDPAWALLVDAGGSGGDDNYILAYESGTDRFKYYLLSGEGTISGVGSSSYGAVGKWVYAASVLRNSTATTADGLLYLNGTRNTIADRLNYTFGDVDVTINPLRVGAQSKSLARYVNGSYTEVRISNVTRSPDYLNQTFQVVTNQTTYVIFGAEEAVGTTPPAPINLVGTSWESGVNWTWTADSGVVTNSYNISHNATWTNGSSTEFYNHTVGCGNTSTMQIWAWNTSFQGNLSATAANDTQNATACPTPTPTPTPTPPLEAGNLTCETGESWINFAWNSSFTNVSVYLDGVFSHNASDSIDYYLLSDLKPNENHTIYLEYDFNNTSATESQTCTTKKVSVHNNFFYMFLILLGLFYLGRYLPLMMIIAFVLSLYATYTALSQTTEGLFIIIFPLLGVLSLLYLRILTYGGGGEP